MSAEVLRGGCLCGAVTYQVEGPFLRSAHRHCSRCRRATGSAHASNLYLDPSRFRWVSGKASTRRYHLPSARSLATTFCTKCGAPLPHHTRSGREIVVPAGSLHEEPNLNPQCHIFFESRPGWSCANEGVSRFEEYADGWPSEPAA